MKISPLNLFYVALALGLIGPLAHSTYHYLGRFSHWQSKSRRWLAISPLFDGMALVVGTVIYVTSH